MFNLHKKETDTAHQRQVKDMIKAGINPVLSASQGGASSASGTAAKAESTQKDMENLGATAQEAMQNKTAIENTQQETQNKEATEKLTNLQQQTEAAKAQQTAASAKALELENERKKYDLPNAKSRSDYEKKQREIDSKMQKYDNVIRRINDTGGAIGSAFSSIIPQIRIQTNAYKNRQNAKKAQNWDNWQQDMKTNPIKYGELP